MRLRLVLAVVASLGLTACTSAEPEAQPSASVSVSASAAVSASTSPMATASNGAPVFKKDSRPLGEQLVESGYKQSADDNPLYETWERPGFPTIILKKTPAGTEYDSAVQSGVDITVRGNKYNTFACSPITASPMAVSDLIAIMGLRHNVVMDPQNHGLLLVAQGDLRLPAGVFGLDCRLQNLPREAK